MPTAPGRCSRSGRRGSMVTVDGGRSRSVRRRRRQPRQGAQPAAGRRACRPRPDHRRAGGLRPASGSAPTIPGRRRSIRPRRARAPGAVALLAGVGMQTAQLDRRAARLSVPDRARAARRRPGLRGADDRRRGDGAAVTPARSAIEAEDRRLIAAFLEMMAAEAGAARNTLLAYERDLRGASELLGGGLAAAPADALKRLGEAWLPLKRATVARKAAALRRFFGFLPRGCAPTIRRAALPRPASERPLPKMLDHRRRRCPVRRDRARAHGRGKPADAAPRRADRAALRLGPARDRTGVAAAQRGLRPTGRS